ncbi:hypothetical protein K1W54_42540, partial [Micromonospora sp. CPCC 205371]|nr:hypothetical protein [Micromonospora sp. CPCC 205371]
HAQAVPGPAVAAAPGREPGARDRGVQAGELIIRPIGGRESGRETRVPVVVTELDGDFVAQTDPGPGGRPLRIAVDSWVPGGTRAAELYALRALVHELRELDARRLGVMDRARRGTRRVRRVDVLDRHTTVPPGKGVRLGPNDHGLLGEAIVLVRRTGHTDAADDHALAAWIDATGLRDGYPGADAKWRLAEPELPSDVRDAVGRARERTATTKADRALVALHRELVHDGAVGVHLPQAWNEPGAAGEWFDAFEADGGLDRAAEVVGLGADDVSAWLDAEQVRLRDGYPGADEKWELVAAALDAGHRQAGRELIAQARQQPPAGPAGRAGGAPPGRVVPPP